MFVVIDDFPIKHRWLSQLSEASPFLGFPSLPSWRLGLDCTPNRTVLLDLLVYHDWKKGLKFVGDMYFSIKMCFYTTELLHRFLDFAVGCCLSRRCHDRSPQPGISIMLAPGGQRRTPGPMSREIIQLWCLSNPVQVQFWYMVTWPICVYNYMCK